MNLSDPLAHFRWLYAVDYSDPAAVAERWDPELVINQDPAIPGRRRVYRGYAGLAELVEETLENYERQSWMPAEAIPLGDDRWVVLLHVRGRGRVTGLPIELEIGHVVTLRAGRILELDSHLGWNAAREAAGLA